jgi:hypothetical protein
MNSAKETSAVSRLALDRIGLAESRAASASFVFRSRLCNPGGKVGVKLICAILLILARRKFEDEGTPGHSQNKSNYPTREISDPCGRLDEQERD